MNELLPEEWSITTINEVTINTAQRQPQQDESFVYIDIGSIDRENKCISTPEEMLGQDAPSRARKVVQTGDVLVSTTRPNLNAVAMVPGKFNDQIASTGFDVLRAPNIDPRWLFYIVRTTDFVQSMSELVQGALYPAIRSKDIRSFEIPLAPLNEQKRIADKLDRLLEKVDACRERCDRIPLILKRFRQSVLADRLESRYQTARAKCDQLTPAVLEKAFQGELVPQDPNDEPASVLLERIKSLRTNAEAKQTKPQRRKTAPSR